MTDAADRRAELIAAALASDLSPDESAEFDAMRATDPTVDEELAAFGVLLEDVRSVGRWDDTAPSPELSARIDGIAAAGRGRPEVTSSGAPLARVDGGSRARRPSRSRRPLLVAGAAACVALGVGGGVLVATPAAPPDGPAGALGAVEGVAFGGEPDGVEVNGDVIAHTWGTETVLTIDGLPAGEVYDVVVLDAGGREWSAGTFLGSDVTISCRMNASVLREDAAEVLVVAGDGTRIASADLPEVVG